MPDPQSIPYFETEALIASIELRDERDELRNRVLQWFDRVMHMAAMIKVRQFVRAPHELRGTTSDGKGYALDPGTISDKFYSPGWVKPQLGFTTEDLNKFAAADAAQTENESALAMKTADRVITRLAGIIGGDDAEWRLRACIGALMGTFQLTIGEVVQTINYGLTQIVTPGVEWDNIAATIIIDLRNALETFRDNANGTPCDTIFYNPKIVNAYFVPNTQIQAWLQKSEIFARQFLGLGGGLPIGDALGHNVSFAEGVTWIPVEGSYTKLDGTTVDRWDMKKLVLCNREEMGSEWSMLYDALQCPSEQMHLEIFMPPQGSDVKAPRIQGFDNGIPTFQRPDCVQPWQVVS